MKMALGKISVFAQKAIAIAQPYAALRRLRTANGRLKHLELFHQAQVERETQSRISAPMMLQWLPHICFFEATLWDALDKIRQGWRSPAGLSSAPDYSV